MAREVRWEEYQKLQEYDLERLESNLEDLLELLDAGKNPTIAWWRRRLGID